MNDTIIFTAAVGNKVLSKFDPATIVKQIQNFSKLDAGWDYGDGEVIHREVINKTVILYCKTIQYGLKASVHPTSEGGITLILSAKDLYLDITVQSDLTYLVTKERGFGFKYSTIFSDIEMDEILVFEHIRLLSTENCLECVSSETFTSKSSFPTKDDFKVTVSNFLETEFQFLNLNAR